MRVQLGSSLRFLMMGDSSIYGITKTVTQVSQGFERSKSIVHNRNAAYNDISLSTFIHMPAFVFIHLAMQSAKACL